VWPLSINVDLQDTVAQVKMKIKEYIARTKGPDAGVLGHLRRFPHAHVDVLMLGDHHGPSPMAHIYSSHDVYGNMRIAVSGNFQLSMDQCWILEDYATLKDYGVSLCAPTESPVSSATDTPKPHTLFLTVRPGAMAVWVQFPDLGKFSLDVDTADAIASFKFKIKQHMADDVSGIWQDLARVPQSSLGLVFAGQVLNEQRALADYRITHQSTVTGFVVSSESAQGMITASFPFCGTYMITLTSFVG
jgi:hypothetical protein